jgi:hypothetical protein
MRRPHPVDLEAERRVPPVTRTPAVGGERKGGGRPEEEEDGRATAAFHSFAGLW